MSRPPGPLSLELWVTERRDNCRRIAATKVGSDQGGWLEDAAYFQAILDRLKESTSVH
jgi:hypothetical protein